MLPVLFLLSECSEFFQTLSKQLAEQEVPSWARLLPVGACKQLLSPSSSLPGPREIRITLGGFTKLAQEQEKEMGGDCGEGIWNTPGIFSEHMCSLHSHRALGKYTHLCKCAFHFITISCLLSRLLLQPNLLWTQLRINWLVLLTIRQALLLAPNHKLKIYS